LGEVFCESGTSQQAGGNFEVVERPIPEPARGQIRIKVEACGICHSDALVKEGHWPGFSIHECGARDCRARGRNWR